MESSIPNGGNIARRALRRIARGLAESAGPDIYESLYRRAPSIYVLD